MCAILRFVLTAILMSFLLEMINKAHQHHTICLIKDGFPFNLLPVTEVLTTYSAFWQWKLRACLFGVVHVEL